MHPLDPLTADEVRAAVQIIRRERTTTDSWRFASVDLAEPAKAELLAWRPDEPLPRRAFAVLWDRSTNEAYEAVADLTAGRVASWTPVPGMTPNVTIDEYHDIDVALHEHPEVLAAVARRGITDPSLVLFDVWTYGAAVMPEQWRDRRLGWCDVWLRATPHGNPYAHPVSGLKIIVDLNSVEVLLVEDHHDHGLPEVSGEYDPAVHGRDPDPPLKPLMIHQPEGPSFTLDGHRLTWQNWSLRIGFNAREGLVLHQVRFADSGEARDVAHRLSFVEMVVPYRDPGFDHYRRTAFDIGEWGLGAMTTPLELGCDCLGEIVYLDAVVADSAGEPLLIPQAICLHEEDAGVLWKHVDPLTGAQSRRARRMVVSFHATVANYEYLVYWRFYADGSIECEVRATGIMVTTPLPADGDRSPYGATVDRRTYAPVPPALHRRPARPGRRRPRQHRGPAGRRRAADQSGQPVRTGHDQPGDGDRLRGRVGPRRVLGHPADLVGDQPQPDQRPRRPGRVQDHPHGGDPHPARPGLAGLPTGAGDRAHPMGHRVRRRRALAGGGVPDPVATPTPGSPSGSRRTRRWSTPTWCSGTSSASTTSPGRRTGR